MNQINLGLIGLGRWAREAYVPLLKELSTVNVTAVAARTEATRCFAKEQFGQDLSVYCDYHDLLGVDDVQAVIIALPNELHGEAVEAAANSNKHILFEPPIGLSEQEIRHGLAAISSTPQVVQVDHELRYLPVMQFIREQVASGAIGDLLMAKIRLWCDWGHGGGEWIEDAEPQGFFLWLGCWYLDVLDCVFGESPTKVSVTGGYAMNRGLLDHGWVTMGYTNGRIGEFEFSLITVEGTQITLEVAGTRGEIQADLIKGTARWRRKDKPWQEDSRPCTQPVHGFVGMRESITDFISAIDNARPAQAGTQVCRRVHEAVMACAQSESERRTVPVETVDDS